MRGEQTPVSCSRTNIWGSPPLARGTDSARDGEVIPRRITPACAGNSRRRRGHYCRGGDHPRLRGEQPIVAPNSFAGQGSPPLARGTDSGHHRREQRPRITPACAGNRSPSRRLQKSLEDHPRLRGEQKYIPDDAQKLMGSPPLARGTGQRGLSDCPR